MKRLVDQSPCSVPEQRLTELLRRIEPSESDPFRKRRVWASLMSARSRPMRRGPWAVRVLWVAVLLGGGTAAAALGSGALSRGWVDDWFGNDAVDGPPATKTARGTPRSQPRTFEAAREPSGAEAKAFEGDGRVEREAGLERDASSDDDGGATAEAPRTDTTRGAAEPRREPKAGSADANGASERTRSAAARPTAEPAGEDPTPVLAAIRAWRSDGNAGRAQRLLDGYLRDNPGGALAEDALALSIEVAAARKDPRAVTQAKRYLAAYPRGRFRSLAEKVVDGAR